MKLVIGKEIKPKDKPKNCYIIKIETMEGDADDYHKIVFWEDTEEGVLERYEQYGILQQTSQDDWNTLPFWSIWEDYIYCNCDSGWYDSLEKFKVVYFDDVGNKFKVKLVEEN